MKLKLFSSMTGLLGESVSVAKVRSRCLRLWHLSSMCSRAQQNLTGALLALVNPILRFLVCLVRAMLRISPSRSVCFCALLTEVVPPHVEWSCWGSPADILSWSEIMIFYIQQILKLLTQCLLFHLQQLWKPKLNQELQQQVSQIRGEEIFDVFYQFRGLIITVWTTQLEILF